MNDDGNDDLRKAKTGYPWHANVDWEGRQHNPVRGGLNWLVQTYPPQDGEGRPKIFERFSIPPGKHHLKLVLYDRPEPNLSQTLLDGQVDLAAGEVLILNYPDGSTGKDPQAGGKLCSEISLGTNASCRICHSLAAGDDLVGPSFAGIASRAGERVPGLSGEDYSAAVDCRAGCLCGARLSRRVDGAELGGNPDRRADR